MKNPKVIAELCKLFFFIAGFCVIVLWANQDMDDEEIRIHMQNITVPIFIVSAILLFAGLIWWWELTHKKPKQ